MSSTAARVSLQKYLNTLYRPDRDYVDGVLERRNLGDLDHSLVVGNLIAFFGSRSKQTGIVPLISLRIRPRHTLIRVADIVLSLGKPMSKSRRSLRWPVLKCFRRAIRFQR